MSEPITPELLAAIRERSDFIVNDYASLKKAAPRIVYDRADLLAEVDRLRAQRAALIALHDYDELIFGGFWCMHCTPRNDDDEVVPWPCPTLRTVGMTDDEAVTLIQAQRAEIEAQHQQTLANGGTR